VIYVLATLGLVLVWDAFRMRGRLAALAVLADADAAASDDHEFVTAPGVTLDGATRRAASAFAREHRLAVLDLVPRDLPAIRAMSFAQLVDPPAYRADRLGAGRSAGHALLVTRELAARAAIAQPADDAAFAQLAIRLKHFGRADIAVAPAEHARAQDPGQRFAVLRAVLGPSTWMALGVLPVFWVIIGLGIWLAPVAGLVTLALWQLQPLIAIAGTTLRSRDLAVVTLLRAPIELWMFARTLTGRTAIDLAAPHRAAYEKLIAGGTERFFEPRRETCPVCGGGELVVHLRNSDLFQHKPGRFTLERCRGCGHVFQNPCLTPEGLDFYYKDFYDGLGEAGMEYIFGFGSAMYHARAKMVRDVAPPARWLDVGAGHGHFCAAARDDLPDTRFDGLDFGESIDEAQRRGWIDTAYRGLFPALAPEFAGRYDAISMSHYLEHTLDPRRELAAARVALAPNGCLLIEVPDPEFVLGKVLRRYWLPWFQPQHQHLLSVKNLERLLREHGFTPLAWHRGQAHQEVDFFFAAWLVLDRIAPPRRLPWRWRGGVAGAWRVVVWTLGAPLLVLAVITDHLAAPIFRRSRVSNTYRVVARKEA
jgi:SAM-dependent methyltransferase